MHASQRDTLVVETLPLVRFLASAVHARVTQISRDDLISAGAEALVKAADAFNADLGVPFNGYARHRISGAIKDEQRRMDWAPREVRAAAKETLQVRDALYSELGRTPTYDEIAQKMGITKQAVSQSLADASRTVMDLEHSGAFDVMSTLVLPEDAAASEEERAVLEVAIDALPERKRRIIRGYYFDDRPIKDIAAELGITSAAVSQHRAEAVRMLRTAMDRHYPGEHRSVPAAAPKTSASALEEYIERIARGGHGIAGALMPRAMRA